MSNIDALAVDLFATISAHFDKRVAPLLERMAEMQTKLDSYAEADEKRHEAALEEICTTDATVKQLGEQIAELKAIPPPKDGEPGAAGKDGSPGKDAEPIDFDAMVKAVVAVIPVPTNGQDGEDGRDGRDAVQCDVVDVIDPERKYQRGTLAHHRGGLVRAFKATDPLGDGPLEKSGWAVVVEGVAEETEELKAGGRERVRTTIYTSGKEWTRAEKSEVMIYRGTYKAGTEYERGDTSTWDGSTWHCEKDTKAEPGNSSDWKLIVKRGNPGKDGTSIKGDPGPPGSNGKDLTHMMPDGTRYR